MKNEGESNLFAVYNMFRVHTPVDCRIRHWRSDPASRPAISHVTGYETYETTSTSNWQHRAHFEWSTARVWETRSQWYCPRFWYYTLWSIKQDIT